GRFSALNAEFERMGIAGKFRRNLRRFLLPEMEGVSVEIQMAATKRVVSTDTRGRYTVRFKPEIPTRTGVATYFVQLPEPNGGNKENIPFEATKAVGQIVIPPEHASIGVISDIDDTIVSTHVQSPFRMLLHTALTNVSDLHPTPGFPS